GGGRPGGAEPGERTAGGRQERGAGAREQRRAVAAIKKLGGKVFVDEQSPDRPVVKVDLSRSGVTDAALAQLKSLTRLETLDLRSTKVSDAGLRHLRPLTRLKVLDLFNTRVTDAGVRELEKALPQVKIERCPRAAGKAPSPHHPPSSSSRRDPGGTSAGSRPLRNTRAGAPERTTRPCSTHSTPPSQRPTTGVSFSSWNS